MIQATELRIGNLFQYKCEHGYSYANITTKNIQDLIDDPQDDFFEPIPITEEWLIKFGFYIVSDNEYKTRFDILEDGRFDYILVKHNLCTSAIRFEGGSLFNIKYVHQLQNLYFALTQKEL